jgi:uncharacterized protein YacL (UPF0231 family)
MSEQIQPQNNSDEIDLKEIFKYIGNFFKKIFKRIFQVIDFYKKKWVVVLGLVILGLAGGYVLDYVINKNPEIYKQEVIVEPNYGSIGYFYNSVEELINAVKQKNPIPDINLTEEQWQNITEITLMPIINTSDFLNILNNEAAQKIVGENLKNLDSETLTDPSYAQFYAKHKLTLFFKNKERSEEITNSILSYFKSNEYYSELGSITAENLQKRIQQNDKSIALIDNYLENVNQESSKQLEKGKEFSLYSEGQEPDVAKILTEKNKLLQEQQNLERQLKMNDEVLKVVSLEKVMIEKRKLLNRRMAQLPLLLLIAFSGWHFLGYISREARKFANN